ncbi:MAG: TrkA family potassium uptake protein [Chloroflexota bacterium]
MKKRPFYHNLKHNQRRFWINVRDTYLLVRQFSLPLLLFSLAVIGGGELYYLLSQNTAQPLQSAAHGIYVVLALTFLESNINFPSVWYLQLFFFLMPLVGIGILAQGLADFGLLFFNRRARGKEWIMAVASTYSDHIVLVGLGHLGYRVAQQLNELEEDVIAIDIDTNAETLSKTEAMQVPVIQDDGNRESVLRAAGIAKAEAIVICTQNDGLNTQIAFKARNINPDIRVVIRVFDDYFARTLEEKFGFHALSATHMAAPSFATAAAGVNITRPITIEGESLSLASLEIAARSKLLYKTMSQIEQEYDLSIVLLRRNAESDFHPAGERTLLANDTIAIFGGTRQIGKLVDDNLDAS